jgi:hypothetical protein
LAESHRQSWTHGLPDYHSYAIPACLPILSPIPAQPNTLSADGVFETDQEWQTMADTHELCPVCRYPLRKWQAIAILNGRRIHQSCVIKS